MLLPSYAKFGVNRPAAALFSSLGVHPAGLAQQLAVLNETEGGSKFNYPQMLSWLQGLDTSALDDKKIIEPKSFVQRLSKTIASIRPFQQDIFSPHHWELHFFIAGWHYYVEDGPVLPVQPGDRVILESDPENAHDSDAIRIYSQDSQHLGYVPRCFSRDVSRRLVTLTALVEEVNPACPPHQRVRIKCSSLLVPVSN